MTRYLHRARFILPALIALLVIGSQHAAPGDPVISQEPMFLQGSVKPAFIMAVDDSGSMQWEILANNQDGELIWGIDTSSTTWGYFEDDGSLRNGGAEIRRDYLELFPFEGRGTSRRTVPPTTNFGFARSPAYNPAYYNPTTNYAPWKKSDGSSWSSMDTAAEWQAVYVDPRDTGSQTFDLTADVKMHGPTDSDNTNNGNNDWDFDYYEGMTIPAGTEFYDDCNNVITGQTGWFTVPAGETRVLTGSCDLGVRYFPATYYLTTNTSPDGYTGTPLAVVDGPGGPRNTTLYRYEIKPGNYSGDSNGDGVDDYAAAMTNFANWFTYYRSRNLALVSALTNSFDSVDYLRTGYFTINNRVSVDMYDLEIQADRDSLYTSMTALPANGSTPNRWAVEHLGKQFERTDADAPVQLACQANAGMLFTDGYSNQGGPAVGEHDNGALFFGSAASNTLADTAAKYYTASLRSGAGWDDKVRIPDACATATVLDNKGLDCRNDPHMNFYGITLGALGVRYGAAPYINVPGTPEDEARTAAIATNPAWVVPNDDEPSAVDEIWHATLNGRGKFVNAKSPAAVTEAMQEVLDSVTDVETDAGTRGATGARLSGGSNSFTVEPSFKAEGADWTGDIVAKAVLIDGTLAATPLWSAATKLDARSQSDRDIFFVKTPGASGTDSTLEFNDTNIGAADHALLGLTLAGATAKYTATGAQMPNIVAYLRGETTLEESGTSGLYRARTSVLGDIINSALAIASPKDNFGYYSRFDASGQTYSAYLTAKSTRNSVVYVGANDGMLHAFDASTATCPGPLPDPSACATGTSGDELFAFIPNGVLGKMGRLLDPEYGKASSPHAYFVDGDINVVDIKDGGSWKTVLVGTTGAGGRSIFALDVSDPSSFDQNDVLWELNNTVSGYGDIGHTVGRPLILPLKDGTSTVWAAVFGNGYGGDSRKPALYVVNIMTGALIRKIAPDDGEPGVYNGLGELTAIDTNRDGHSDTIYGGDLRGNVWKFHLEGNASSWYVAFGGDPLFTATDSGGGRQPITGGFRISAGPAGGVTVLFGTGSYVFESDRAAGTNLQTLYAVWDRKTDADNDQVDDDTAAQAVGDRSSLVGQTITSETAGPPMTRAISRNTVNYTNKLGWYLDLSHPTSGAIGERFVGIPRIQNGKVFFATYTPTATDECGSSGRNFLYALDLLSGHGGLGGLTQLGTTGAACTGDCGAVALETANAKNVAPVINTSVMVPSSSAIPGLTCKPGDPGCPTTPTFQQCQVVIYPGGWVLRRPCDRQSWRQIR